MAGDWIKLEITMPDKPEVARMADHLNIDHDAVAGKLIRFWIWGDQQSIDGNDLGVTPSFIDRLTNCPGFSDALVSVGWLIVRNSRLSIPNFNRHNGQTAKNRALTKNRMKRSRDAANVTKPSLEKRREEKRVNRVRAGPFVPPAIEDVRDYCKQRGKGVDPERWMDHYTSNGWMVGKNKMKDWKAAVRTWEKNDYGGNKPPEEPLEYRN